jgi:hypothetical protein
MDGENLSAILWYTCVVVIQFGYQAINSAKHFGNVIKIGQVLHEELFDQRSNFFFRFVSIS